MELIGTSKAIRRVRDEVKRLARSKKNVVIIGEVGVGKRLVAEAIHLAGKDADKPYVRVNLASIEPARLRNVIYGVIERGEFYNPIAAEHGDFTLVEGSTLILEDVDSAGFAAQKAVCDLLESPLQRKRALRIMLLFREEVREGAKRGKIMKCLLDETKDWETIVIPPLRERGEDIPDLIEHFVKETSKDLGMEGMVIDPNAIAVLVRQEWEENVQQLKRTVERSILLSPDKEVFKLPADLVSEEAELARILDRINEGIDFALDSSMEIIEKGILQRTLEKFEFNQSRAARFLKITEDTLRYRMKRLGIPTSRKQ
jgi:DNA-binding NtrC family response regulator